MEPSPEQDRALSAADAWFQACVNDEAERLFYMAGFAGTGKTTLARKLSESWGNVLFAAYTGKAAHVLRQKGCHNARTLHSLIYIRGSEAAEQVQQLKEQLALAEEAAYLDEQEDKIDHPDAVAKGLPIPWSKKTRASQVKADIIRTQIAEAEKLAASVERRGGPMFTLNPASALATADALVVDEVSMVDDRMYRDLLSFGKPILALGDPAQLPPVKGAGAFLRRTPDFLLEQVHRQAQDSAILWAATLVRQGRAVPLGRHGEDLLVIDRNASHGYDMKELVLGADQMLVGRNLTRKNANQRFRSLRGYESSYPVEGDKLVCLQNHNEVGLLNGSLWEVLRGEHLSSQASVALTVSPLDEGMRMRELAVLAHAQYFTGEEPEWYEKSEKEAFDYGYAMTVHKSQGSQWDRVFLQDESSAFREHRNNWLYTGITRAAKKLVLLR